MSANEVPNMNVTFASKDLEWSQDMKETVWQKIIEPLGHHLKSGPNELTVKLGRVGKRFYVMSLTLQSGEGRAHEILCRKGEDFSALVHDVSVRLRACVRRENGGRKFSINPLHYLPAVNRHTARML